MIWSLESVSVLPLYYRPLERGSTGLLLIFGREMLNGEDIYDFRQVNVMIWHTLNGGGSN